jgi:tetratricopeptide (TPR) repeat protein
LEASLEAHRETLGPLHPDVVQAMLDLSSTMPDVEERRPLLMEASRQCDAMDPSQDMLRAAVLNSRGALEIHSSRFGDAVSLLLEADRILASFPVTSSERITVRQNLSSAYARQGRWDLAEPMQREMVESRRQLNGEDSDITAQALENWAVTLANQGRHRESGEAFAQVLAIFERTLDPGHWRIANTARNVGQLLALQGRYEEALPHLERSLEINRDRGNEFHRVTYQRGQRAMIWLGLDQVERARNELADVAAKLADPEQGFSPSYAADGQIWLGIAEFRAARVNEARSCFRRALEIRSSLLQGDHPKLAEARLGLAVSGAPPPEMDFQADLELYRAWGLSHPLMLELLHTNRP